MLQAFDAKSLMEKGMISLLSSFLLLSPGLAKSRGFVLGQRANYIAKPYDFVRAILRSSGWEPESVHGPYQDYPEIHCSLSGACTGYWLRDMKELYVGVDVTREPFFTESIQSEREYKKENAS